MVYFYDTGVFIMAEQYIYLGTQDLRGKVWGGFSFSGGVWKIVQSGASSFKTGGRFDPTGPDGFSCTFNVAFATDADASTFLAYCAAHTHDAGIAFYPRTTDWYFLVWGIAVKQASIDVDSPTDYNWYQYQVTLFFYSPYTYQASATAWTVTAQNAPQSKAIANLGHYSGSFESLAVTCKRASSQNVHDLTFSNGTTTLTLFAGSCLAEEVWTLLGNDNLLTETFNLAAPSALTPFTYDAVVNVTPTYQTGKILIDDTNWAYFKLAGPNLSNLPLKMTADLSLDGGGATGLAYVEYSADGSVWVQALTQANFVSGLTVYYLPGTEFMTDIYVRFRNASGTAGVYLRIGWLRFDVTRKIQSGGVPLQPIGNSTATLDCNGSYSKSLTIAGSFRSIRHMV